MSPEECQMNLIGERLQLLRQEAAQARLRAQRPGGRGRLWLWLKRQAPWAAVPDVRRA